MATNAAPELLIVMGPGATPDQTEHVVARLAEVGVAARVSRGREATVIGAIGERVTIVPGHLPDNRSHSRTRATWASANATSPSYGLFAAFARYSAGAWYGACGS